MPPSPSVSAPAIPILLFAAGCIAAEPPGSATDSAAACTPTTWYANADNDGLGSAQYTTDACEAPAGYADNGEDCDDTDAAVLDGADWYADTDGDGYGYAGTASRACDAPEGHVADATDCDDADDAVHPGAAETCDEVDQDCDGTPDDDPTDGGAHYADVDGDGWGDPATRESGCTVPDDRVQNDADCDDADAAIHPEAEESCDEVDQDCDGAVDENPIDPPTWYADLDGDGHGGTSLSFAACDAPENYVGGADDCDDTDATVSPVATETCNDVDDDCDDEVDEDAPDAPSWYADTDGDGFGNAASPSAACDAPTGTVADATDCDDTDPDVSPADAEVCGGVDENCDGVVDEDSAVDAPTWYADLDGDGYGDPDAGAPACTMPAGWYAAGDDCDPADAEVHPGAEEVCGNAADDDCDGEADDDCMPTGTYYDSDATTRLDGTGVSSLMGYDPDWFAAGDVDEDGIGDLVIGVPWTHSSAAYAGALWFIQGPPSSGSLPVAGTGDIHGTIESEYIGESMAILGDIDGDGSIDVASEWQYFDAVLITSGAWSGSTTAAAYAATTGTKASDTAWGTGQMHGVEGLDDWDGDGQADMAVATDQGVRVYLGPIPTGTVNLDSYRELVVSEVGTLGERMAHGDFDDDGYDDLALADWSSDRAYICWGDTSGTYLSIAVVCPDYVTPGAGLYDVANVGDADGDGVDDLGLGQWETGDTWVLSGDISGAVSASTASFVHVDGGASGEGGWSISGADIDADGLSELLIGAQFDDGGATDAGAGFLYESPLSGDLDDSDATASIFGTHGGWYLGETAAIVPDVTGEGCPDVLVGAGYASHAITSAGAFYLYPCE